MIDPLDLNLASRPFKNNTLLWTGYSLGLIVLVLFTVWNVTTYVESGRRLAETRADLIGIDEQLADLDRRQGQANRQLDRSEYDIAMLTSQATGANGVIEWKAFSWTGLFNHMTNVQPWNVHLSAVRPLFRTQAGGSGNRTDSGSGGDEGVGILVEGFAKNLEALLEFERALFRDRHFDKPEPKRHQPTDSNEIVFEMEFTYYPDGMPDEVGRDTPAAEVDSEAVDENTEAADTGAISVEIPVEGVAVEADPEANPKPEVEVPNEQPGKPEDGEEPDTTPDPEGGR